jgi:long-subunit fatty acid transport protein
MRQPVVVRPFAWSLALLCLTSAATSSATTITEFPDNGSEQMARGGAWVARASDPLAVHFNPAGLAGQRTAVTIQANLSFHDSCFTRVKSANDTTSETGFVDPGGTYPQVCAESHVFANPQLAFNYRVTDRIGVALAVLGPSGVGSHTWPDFVDTPNGRQPAPNRYLLVGAKTTFLTPTLGAGFEVMDGLRLGAAFQWGILRARFNNASPGLNADGQSPRNNDIDATLIASDYFVPGFKVGALYSPTEFFDVGFWYKWSDSVKAKGDVYTRANYYTGNPSRVIDGDTTMSDCNAGPGSAGICGPGKASLTLAVPMEARVGFRYHQPRGVPKKQSRDPIADDLFDAEIDFTWANNSAIDNLQIRFPGNSQNEGIIPVNGVPGGVLPPNADVPHNYKDVLGVRIGGDFNVLPNQLALRAGGYFESKGQDDRYQNIDFIGGSRLGLAAGATYRIQLGGSAVAEDSKTYSPKGGSIDVMLGFMHVFVSDQKNNDPNAAGISGLAGSPCNPAVTGGGLCEGGRQRYRTNWPVNLGTITNALNVINVGAAYRF